MANKTWTSKRASLAGLSRGRSPDDPLVVEARRDLRAARAEDYVRELADADLTDDQRDRLAILLTVGDVVTESRAACGLPPRVEDPAALGRAAAVLTAAKARA